MPTRDQIDDIVERTKNPRLGDREWRRFPARKGVRPPREPIKLVEATLDLDTSGGLPRVKIFLKNRQAVTLKVATVGTVPEVFIELDGNRSHEASLPVAPGADIVEIRQDGKDGEVLAEVFVEEAETESFT